MEGPCIELSRPTTPGSRDREDFIFAASANAERLWPRWLLRLRLRYPAPCALRTVLDSVVHHVRVCYPRIRAKKESSIQIPPTSGFRSENGTRQA